MNTKEEKFYCLVLSSGQLQFLTDPLQGKSRCACLFSLLQMDGEDSSVLGDEGSPMLGENNVETMTGKVIASKLQLAAQWAINRKTVDKMIDHFNEQGLITTRSTTKGSVHTLEFLSGWIAEDGQVKKNPYYKRPTPKPRDKEPAMVSEEASRAVAHTDNGQPTLDSSISASASNIGMVAHTGDDNDSTNMYSNERQPRTALLLSMRWRGTGRCSPHSPNSPNVTHLYVRQQSGCSLSRQVGRGGQQQQLGQKPARCVLMYQNCLIGEKWQL